MYYLFICLYVYTCNAHLVNIPSRLARVPMCQQTKTFGYGCSGCSVPDTCRPRENMVGVNMVLA